MKATKVKTNKQKPLTVSKQKVTEIFLDSFATKSDVHNLETKLSQDMHNIETRLSQDMHNIEAKLSQDMHNIEAKLSQDIHNLEKKLDNEIQGVKHEIDGVKRDVFWLKWIMAALLVNMLAGFTWLASENANTRQELKADMNERMDKLEAGQKENQRLLLQLIQKK